MFDIKQLKKFLFVIMAAMMQDLIYEDIKNGKESIYYTCINICNKAY